MNCQITVKTPLNPTEDVDKVIKSLINVFDCDQMEITDDYVSVSGDENCLLKFKDELEIRKIRNTANHILNRGAHDQVIFFKLNKQAAYAGVINFTEENLSPLGEIDVKIETEDVERFINWLAPQQKCN
ncbi:MAG: hypothetical protein LLF83_08525 [Methanobacterium sp.]|nr:hypothetical protein [Methanobacterium sp.]